MATLLLPSSAADRVAASADFTFPAATLIGDHSSSTDRAHAWAVLPSTTGSFRWLLNADSLVVNWTRYEVVMRGQPSNLSEPQGGTSLPPTSGEEAFSVARANATSRSSASNLLGVSKPGARIDWRIANGELQMLPGQQAGWNGGDAAPNADSQPAPATSAIFKLPDGLAESRSSNGTLRIEGDFSIFLWDMRMVVHEQQTRHEFNSGTWVSQAPLGSPTGVWMRTRQLLRLDVLGGDLEIRTEGRPVKTGYERLAVEGEFSARLEAATGSLRHGATQKMVQAETITFSGTGQLFARNSSAQVPSLTGSVWFESGTVSTVETVAIDPVDTGAKTTTESGQVIPSPDASKMKGWSFLFLLLAIPVGLVVWNRVDPFRPDHTDVEWAILSGNPRRARRWARRLVRRDPTNPDSVFLYGSALLQTGSFKELTEKVEPLALNMSPEERAGIAYLLAVASRKNGNTSQARRWAAEAATQPTLLGAIQNDPEWRAILGSTEELAYA